MGFNVTTSDAIECIKNLKKIRHDGMQFDACLSKAISDLEEFEEYKKKYAWIFNYSDTLHYDIHKMTEKLIKDENELLYRCLYSYGITKENLLNNIDRIELREVADDFGIDSVKRFYIDGEYAFTIKRISTMITNKPTAVYTEGSLCYKVETIIEDLEEA